MEQKEDFQGVELEKFLEAYEVERIRDSFRERVITIVIGSLGIISALAWDDALKGIFEKIFGEVPTLVEKIIYAFIITIFAAVFSVYLGKIYSKPEKKK